jgi:SAM-dependent methyltransferase
MNQSQDPRWAAPQNYEQFMGRWSARLAPKFAEFAGVREGEDLLDLGCGTGSLTRALIESRPRRIAAVDLSPAFVEYAREHIQSAIVDWHVADAQDLPLPSHAFDRGLSMLVLNFIPDAAGAVREVRRVLRPGGTFAAATWDYTGGMQMLHTFWDTAASLDPDSIDEAEAGMPFRRAGELSSLFRDCGLADVEETVLEVTAEFQSFEDYWQPFSLGIGPAGAYVGRLDESAKAQLERALHERVGDAPIFALQARAARGISR